MQKAIIDLSKNGIIPVFHAKQGDTSRRVAITLLDNGLPYDTAADAVSVWYSGPSGEGNYSDGIEKDGSTLTILVNPNMTAASGRHTCAVMLSNESGRCTTWNFCVEVAYTPALGSEEAKAYFEAFEAGELAADIAAVDARTAKAVAELNARVSAIIASGTATEGNTELIDIRTGADGKVYQTAGDAVRGQIGELKSDLVDESTKMIDLMMDYVYQYLGKSTIAVKNVAKKGTFDVTTGQVIEHDTRYYTPFYIPNYIKSLLGTSATLYVWDENENYLGFVLTDYSIGKSGSLDIAGVDLDIIRKKYPKYKFKIAFYGVGDDALLKLKSFPNSKFNMIPSPVYEWVNGYITINIDNNQIKVIDSNTRIASREYVSADCKYIIAKDKYLFRIGAVDSNGNFLGNYTENNKFESIGKSKPLKNFDLTEYPDYRFVLTILHDDNSDISTKEGYTSLIYLPFSPIDLNLTNEKEKELYTTKLRYLPFLSKLNEENKTSLCLCAAKTPIVQNKIPMHTGFLFQKLPNDDGTVFYGTTLENAMELGKIMNSTKTEYLSMSTRLQAISPKDGRVILTTRGDRGNLYVWDGNDTYKLFDGASLKPMGWLYNSGVDFVIDADGVEHCIFAEYDGSTQNKNGFYVWKGTYPYTSESDWKTVFHKDISWEPVVANTIVHFHQIRRDPWTNILYLTSGDKEGQLNWWYSTDYGDTWTLLISDTSDNYSWEAHILRCINFVFTKDYIYWAVDHGTNSCLNRIKRNSSGIIDLSTREKLCDLPFAIATNSICYVESPNGIFLYTRVDTGSEYESYYGTKVPVLFWSFKTEKLYNLMELGLTNNSWGGHRGKCYLNYTSGQQPYPAMGFSDDTRCYFDIAGADNSNIGTIFYDI